MGAARMGMESFSPHSSNEVSGALTSCKVRILKRYRPKASRLTEKALPVPTPPMPGTSPAHARPLQTGQTRQYPFNFSLACSRNSARSILHSSG